MTHGALSLWIFLSIAGQAASARAFSDPERFTTSAAEGGGGGRFFTGSRADGYTCAVCHRGGTPPQVGISGLPRAGYAPGQVVEAELIFGGSTGNHAVALEIVDDAGRDLGLELVPEPQIFNTERCGGAMGAKRASYITQIGERRVLGVEACDAKAVRFRFRTPAAPRILFVATVLASDNSASIEGDGVTEITQSLFQNGQTARAASDSGCSAVSGTARTDLSFGLLAGIACLRLRARRRRLRGAK